MGITYKMPSGDREIGDFLPRRTSGWMHIVWVITHSCNLGCDYCTGFNEKTVARSIPTTHGVDKTIDAFKKMRDNIKKNIYLTITGGEPTLVPELIELCQRLNDNGFLLNIETNFTTDGARRLVENIELDDRSQIQTMWHRWKMENDKGLAEKWIKTINTGLSRNLNCVLKVIAIPKKLNTLEASLRKIQKQLLCETPVIITNYNSGTPKGRKYPKCHPYLYTDDQKKLLMHLRKYRREILRAVWSGAGWFKGMLCDVGRSFAYMNMDGRLFRCVPMMGAGKNVYMGKLPFDGAVKIPDEPLRCELDWCACSTIGLWYGHNPWEYVDGVEEKDAYYCRYGPDWRT